MQSAKGASAQHQWFPSSCSHRQGYPGLLVLLDTGRKTNKKKGQGKMTVVNTAPWTGFLKTSQAVRQPQPRFMPLCPAWAQCGGARPPQICQLGCTWSPHRSRLRCHRAGEGQVAALGHRHWGHTNDISEGRGLQSSTRSPHIHGIFLLGKENPDFLLFPLNCVQILNKVRMLSLAEQLDLFCGFLLKCSSILQYFSPLSVSISSCLIPRSCYLTL